MISMHTCHVFTAYLFIHLFFAVTAVRYFTSRFSMICMHNMALLNSHSCQTVLAVSWFPLIMCVFSQSFPESFSAPLDNDCIHVRRWTFLPRDFDGSEVSSPGSRRSRNSCNSSVPWKTAASRRCFHDRLLPSSPPRTIFQSAST